MTTPTPIQNAFGGPRVSERFESAGLPKNREDMGTIRPELQILKEVMEKSPELAMKAFENLQKQIALTKNIPPSIQIQLTEAQKKYNEGSFQLSKQLIDKLEDSTIHETIPEALIKDRAEKADAYLVNTLHPMNPKKSVLNITTNIQRDNPFYGDIEAPALIQYKKEGEEKNYAAEDSQEALKGLPIYKKDAKTPKIYEAVSPNGGEKRIIYWIPNNPAIKNFEGHWAMKGQMRDQEAFIPDRWEIREIEEPEKQNPQIRGEIAQEKKDAPQTIEEVKEVKTTMNQPEKRKSVVQKLASQLTTVLQREIAERTQGQPLQKGINGSVIARYEANFSEIIQRAESKKQTASTIPETTAKPTAAHERKQEATETPQTETISSTIETQEISEKGAMAYIMELFEMVRKTFGAKTIPESEKTATEQTPEEEIQAKEALLTLEEIFANMEISTPSEKTVPMNELLTTNEQTTAPEQESIDVEIETLKTNTLKTLQHMRLAFE